MQKSPPSSGSVCGSHTWFQWNTTTKAQVGPGFKGLHKNTWTLGANPLRCAFGCHTCVLSMCTRVSEGCVVSSNCTHAKTGCNLWKDLAALQNSQFRPQINPGTNKRHIWVKSRVNTTTCWETHTFSVLASSAPYCHIQINIHVQFCYLRLEFLVLFSYN